MMLKRLGDRLLKREESLLHRVRWLFVLLNVLMAVTAPMEATYETAPGGVRSLVMVLAFSGVGWWAVAYDRRAGRGWWLDVVPFALLVVGGIAGGAWDPFLGRLVMALFLHALYRPTGMRLLVLGGAYVAVAQLVGVALGLPPESVLSWLTGTLSMLFFFYIMQTLASTMIRHQRLRDRDTVLTEAVGWLLAEHDPDRIGEMVAESTLRLVETHEATSTVWRGGEQELHLVASAGSRPVTLELVSLAVLPESLQKVYYEGQAVVLGAEEMATVHRHYGLDEPWTSAVAAPIVAGGEARGLIVLTSTQALDDDLAESLQRFAHEVSLAQQLAEREALLTGIIENSPDLIALVDRRGLISFVSPALGRWTGVGPEAYQQRPIGELLQHQTSGHPVASAELATTSGMLLRLTGHAAANEVEVTSNALADGSYVLNIRDVAERRNLEAEITHRAFHDGVTGLPNRTLFLERLQRAIADQQEADALRVVALFDIDDFKTVNDRLGHAAGDALLVEIARRLGESTRRLDVAARLGGDEFALLLDDVDDAAHATAIIERVLEDLRRPHLLDGTEVTISASAGAAVIDTADVDEVLGNADTAMYVAKARGKNRCALYEAAMHERAATRQRQRSELEVALATDQLVLHYQPILELAGGTPVGVEALVRWQHPLRGLVAPDQFVPLAEESGLIASLGRWVLDRACREVATWPASPDSAPPSLSINLSPIQLRAPDLVAEVATALHDSGLQPAQLVLEVTETALVDDIELARETLHSLRALGVRIAVDDFGTGSSSFSHLQRLPLDIIKIDRAFIDVVDAGPEQAALAEAIIKLAGTLKLETIAEGVERPEQRRLLETWGCTHAQGWLWAPAERAEQARDRLRASAVGQPRPERA